MCIAIPMQVVESKPGVARCRGRYGEAWVNTAIVGDQPSGAWLLVFHDMAREVLDQQAARQITDALEAVELAVQGGDVEHLFADLVGREPELPKHLRQHAQGGDG